MLKTLKGLLQGVAGGGDSANDVRPVEARDRLAGGGMLVDVREPDEWASGHAPGARHIPLGQLERRMHELPKDGEIITVCRSGGRSSRAADILRRAGFQRVRNLAGGMNAWKKDGLPVEGAGQGPSGNSR